MQYIETTQTKDSKQLIRFKIQGTQNIDQQTVDEVGSWLRLALVFCAVAAGIGTILASPIILVALIPVAAAAAIFDVHPIDHIYNFGIRRWTGTRALPKRGIPTRIACGVGGLMMAGTAYAFYSGAMLFGYFLGGQLVMVATLAATTDICLPSVVYQLTMGRSDLVKQLFG